MDISPKYIMTLIQEINDLLWNAFPESKYKNVKYYIRKWQRVEYEDNFWNIKRNFEIIEKNGNIDLLETLHSIEDFELIVKMAIDLWIETRDYIPAVSELQNRLKDNYDNIYQTFMKAYKAVPDDPNIAIGLANSALESIIKTILQDETLGLDYESIKTSTLYNLTNIILKKISIYPGSELPKEIKQMWSGILNIAKAIEELRSTKTEFHWKAKNEQLITNRSLGYFTVNIVSSIWLFLLDYYKKIEKQEINLDDELLF